MKKSGNTPVRTPPARRYRPNTFPAKNNASRGIGVITNRASAKNPSNASIEANRTDNSA